MELPLVTGSRLEGQDFEFIRLRCNYITRWLLEDLNVTWTPVPFGKYKGETLPQIILTDPDWFFWAVENNAFYSRLLQTEAVEITRKAKSILIPNQTSEQKEVEYFFQPDVGKLAIVQVVEATKPHHVGSSRTHRSSYFDLSMPRQIAKYDKWGGRTVVKAIKIYVFANENIRLTRARCELLFENNSNFA